MTWDWEFAISVFPRILDAMWIALAATITAYILALVFGLFLTLARRSSFRPLALLTYGFIEFVRCTPPLVQLFFAFFALPTIGISLSPFVAGVTVLGIHYSTYISEVYRSGIDSVPKGQWEASTALNFSKAYTWVRVILPQAIPPVIPMLGNYLITMFKETPLLSAITVVEMLQTAKIIGSESFRYLEPFTIAGFLFLALSYPAAVLVRKLEDRMKLAYRK
ncbi:MAG: ectoine/hydroxyectoine ABC transporter permease subunit EhuD [Firmicutes bacterium]|nr:ectoine/hydroxyectoine ABC transporter permease subunit EhuD [Bacillota bacterium]